MATRSERDVSWVRTKSYWENSNMAPASTENESPPTTNRVISQGCPKRHLPLKPDIAPLEAVKDHWNRGSLWRALTLWPASASEWNFSLWNTALIFRSPAPNLEIDWIKNASLSTSQYYVNSGYKPTLQSRWEQTCLHTIGLSPLHRSQ